MGCEEYECEWSVPGDAWCGINIAVCDEGEEGIGEGACDVDVEVRYNDLYAVLTLLAEV